MADYVRLNDRTNAEMKVHAKQKMVDGRADVLNNAGRTVDRWWEYYDGKKTGVKVGTGLVIGAGVAAAGAATHGAAIPVAAVIGIAAGGYVTSKAAETTIGRMWDLGYTGGSRTRAWIHDDGGHKDKAELLEARAHKTIRRAVQHLRTAREKFNKAKQLPQFATVALKSPYDPMTSNTTCCQDAFNAVMALLHVKHHLEKARLYLHPATFLLGRLLEVHNLLYERWNGQDTTQLQSPWHPPRKCESKKCYYDQSTLTGKSSYRGDWVDLGNVNPSQLRKRVSDVLTELSMDIGLQMPLFNRLPQPMRNLIRDAESSYNENRNDCFVHAKVVHAKHGVTNWWDRKTHSEQGAFVVKNVVSGAIAVGGAGVHIKCDEAMGALAALMDMGFTSLDLAMDEDEGVGLSSRNLRRDGKHGQEGLRHAAVHLWEALEVDHSVDEEHFGGTLRALTSTACERTIDYLKNVYKIESHLAKTRTELSEMVELIEKLSKFTKRCLEDVAMVAYEYGKYLEPFWTMPHEYCKGGCYKALKGIGVHV